MNRLLAAVLLMFSVALGVSCSSNTVTDYASLVRNLNKSEATVEPKGNTEQAAEPEVFSGKSKQIKLDGENLVVWEYRDEATAAAEAKFVKFDGFDLRRPPDSKDQGFAVHIDWIAPPHWYTTGRIIVLYVGEKQETLDLLKNLLGPPFAGPGRELPETRTYSQVYVERLLIKG